LCCFGGVASMRETERARALLFCSEKKRCWKERKVRGKKEDVNSVRPSFFFLCSGP
jgi:hypothetical protein